MTEQEQSWDCFEIHNDDADGNCFTIIGPAPAVDEDIGIRQSMLTTHCHQGHIQSWRPEASYLEDWRL
eukprot:4008208-Amphidinium_carterae.1